jgi:hypothetical protein
MTNRAGKRGLPVLTVTVYWGCILLGLAIPGLSTIGVDMLKHGQTLGQAAHQWRLHLFAPGYNLFMIAMLNAIPFILLAVFALLHLGLASPDPASLSRRKTGVLVASLAAIAISAWTHVLTLWQADAQGALAYLFLPFVLLITIPASYVAGWGGMAVLQKSKSSPASSR